MKNLQILKLLAGIGVLATFLSWLLEDFEWLSSALLNIGSGIVTSVVLIYAYDLLIEKQQEKLRKEKTAPSHFKSKNHPAATLQGFA